jgi:hypothetical protein
MLLAALFLIVYFAKLALFTIFVPGHLLLITDFPITRFPDHTLLITYLP